MTRICCELNCLAEAAWMLVDGPTPDDNTDACTEHVGALLQLERETVVTAIGPQ